MGVGCLKRQAKGSVGRATSTCARSGASDLASSTPHAGKREKRDVLNTCAAAQQAMQSWDRRVFAHVLHMRLSEASAVGCMRIQGTCVRHGVARQFDATAAPRNTAVMSD